MSCQVGGEPMPRHSPCAYSAQMSVRVFECLSVMVIFRRRYREGCLRAERLAPHAMLSAGDSRLGEGPQNVGVFATRLIWAPPRSAETAPRTAESATQLRP